MSAVINIAFTSILLAINIAIVIAKLLYSSAAAADYDEEMTRPT
jgi:hypothetical protein